MTHLFQFLRRAFILSLVGIFISVSTFTGEAAAAADEPENVIPFVDVCTLAGDTSPDFKNPPFAYAGLKGVDGLPQNQGVTLDAVQGKFKLEGDKNQEDTEYDGYLYKSTYWKKIGDGYEKVEDEEGKYTPPTIVVYPGTDKGGPAESTLNYFDLTLKNNLPVNVQLKGNLPQTKENLENQSQYTNIHYHGFNGSPLLGSDDVLVDVPSNVTPFTNSPEFTPTTPETILPGGYYPGDDPNQPKYGGPISDYKMTIKIPYIHQSGLFWYHSHAHSLSDNQVRAGLSGGIVIKGMNEYYNTILDENEGLQTSDLDPDPEPEKFSVNQKVMMFKDFNNVLAGGNQNCFTLNGQVQPKITILPGEVQLWRIANVGADGYMNIALEKETADTTGSGELMTTPAFAEPNDQKNFILLARDGDIVEKPVPTNSVLLPPASRVELLVVGSQMNEVQNNKYYLVSDFTTGLTEDDAQWANGGSYLLATVEVNDNSQKVCYEDSGGNALKLDSVDCNEGTEELYSYITTQQPAQQDKVLPPSKDIANGEFEACQDEYHHYAYNISQNGRKIVYSSSVPYDGSGAGELKRCMTQPTERTYPDPLTKKRYFYFSASFPKFFLKGFENELSKSVDPEAIQELYDANRIDKISRVGDLEEWHLVNTGGPHVFHIHQLDFVVTEVTVNENLSEGNGKYNNYEVESCVAATLPDDNPGFKCKLKPQGYRDVINLPGNSETIIRIPFVNPFITGVFVYHCHILAHEDRGMMNNIKAVNPDSFEISGATPTF